MKKDLRHLKWNRILIAALYLILGVLLLLFPQTSMRTLCWLLGGVAALAGIFTILLYLLRDVRENFLRDDLMLGILEIALGIFLLWKTDLALSLAPVLAGVVVIVSGLVKLQAGVDMARLHCGGWWIVLLLAAVSVALGIVLLANPFDAAAVLFMVLGIGLIYSAASDIITAVLLERRVRHFLEEADAIAAQGTELEAEHNAQE